MTTNSRQSIYGTSNLERLLRGRPDGIFVNAFGIGAIGPDLFRAACGMG